MKPCNHPNIEPRHPYTQVVCRVCWLYANDEYFKKKWSETDEPGLLQKAWNLTAALAKHTINGLKETDDLQYNERLAVCSTCDRKTDNWVCKECGCYITIKAKWASEDCPLHKWAPISRGKGNESCGGCSNK